MKRPRKVEVTHGTPGTWMTIGEASYFLGVSRERMRQLIRERLLVVSKRYGRVFVDGLSVRKEAARRRAILKKKYPKKYEEIPDIIARAVLEREAVAVLLDDDDPPEEAA